MTYKNIPFNTMPRDSRLTSLEYKYQLRVATLRVVANFAKLLSVTQDHSKLHR